MKPRKAYSKEGTAIKTGEERLRSVTFTYTGTDQEFTEFLKMMIHDYLAADQIGKKEEPDC